MITEQENLNEKKKPDEVVISKEAAEKRMKAIADWSLQDDTIIREFIFKDFGQAISFVNDIAEIAEQEKHHPDIFISYNKVILTLTTHKSKGLTTKDFALAFKINQQL